jgi:hypothetical protein
VGRYYSQEHQLVLGRIFTKEERAKGGRNAYIQHPELGKIRARSLTHDTEAQRARRYAQLAYEEGIANELRSTGWAVFSPTVVCDRVAVVNGKVYFVEFKRLGQELRPAQQLIHDLVPNMYEIIFRD